PVTAVFTQPDTPRIGRYQRHSGAPPQRTTGEFLDPDGTIDSRKPPQLLTDHSGLELTLAGRAHVLPVTAATPAAPRDRARWWDSFRSGTQYPHRISTTVTATGILGDLRHDTFPGQGMADEHHPPFP